MRLRFANELVVSTLVLMSQALAACGLDGARSAGDSAHSRPSTSASRQTGNAYGDTLGVLVSQLETLPGEFRQAGPHGAWEFEGDGQIFITIAKFGDSAVARLVGCLDDTTRSAVRVGSRPVLVGAVCYEALHRVAYVEKPAEDEPWVGDVPPTADAGRLKLARAAWAEAVRNHEYNLL